LVHPSEKLQLHGALAAGGETTAPAQSDAPQGDGSFGILEGYSSSILYDGNRAAQLPR
jgi:hypothetical protein